MTIDNEALIATLFPYFTAIWVQFATVAARQLISPRDIYYLKNREAGEITPQRESSKIQIAAGSKVKDVLPLDYSADLLAARFARSGDAVQALIVPFSIILGISFKFFDVNSLASLLPLPFIIVASILLAAWVMRQPPVTYTQRKWLGLRVVSQFVVAINLIGALISALLVIYM